MTLIRLLLIMVAIAALMVYFKLESRSAVFVGVMPPVQDQQQVAEVNALNNSYQLESKIQFLNVETYTQGERQVLINTQKQLGELQKLLILKGYKISKKKGRGSHGGFH